MFNDSFTTIVDALIEYRDSSELSELLSQSECRLLADTIVSKFLDDYSVLDKDYYVVLDYDDFFFIADALEYRSLKHDDKFAQSLATQIMRFITKEI